MHKVNGELFSCDITDSGIVPSREGDIQNFALLVLLNGLSEFAQNFIVGFLKLLATHPIHIVVWGNFPSTDNDVRKKIKVGDNDNECGHWTYIINLGEL